MEEKFENIAFGMILHAGNARSKAMEAVYASREGDMEEAEKCLKEAKTEMGEAHKNQNDLLFMSAQETVSMNVLLTHAMDHLAMGSVVYDMAEEMILLRKEMKGEIR
jgi:PTS system cellobiose-specific IIA component